MISKKYKFSVFILFLSIILCIKFFKYTKEVKYVLVFDAGSTSTRLHLYQLKYNNKKKWIFTDEYVEFSAPGMSSYTKNITGVKYGLFELIDKAKIKLKEFQKRHKNSSKVLVMFGATAGLRLIEDDEAKYLLIEAEKVVEESGFEVYTNGRPSILTGDREGALCWMGLAHLTEGPKPGIVDLGGGSTQITYWNNDKLISKSFLGFGLKSARLCILSGPCHPNYKDNNGKHLVSDCLPSGYKSQIEHHGENYSISSSLLPTDSLYEKCHKHLLNKFQNYTKDLYIQDNVTEVPFFIFGYFYDRLVDVRDYFNITVNLDGKITLQEYRKYSHIACDRATHDNPFICLDMVYLNWLLHQGYQFPDNTSLYLMKEIDNIRIGWTVGAALEMVD